MRNLRLLIIFFFLAVSLPLAFVIWQTYNSLAQEERGQLRYFSETIFSRMEKELAELIEEEENRAVDEYGHSPVAAGGGSASSPLATTNYPDYILGYLQNNPDGTFQTPLMTDDEAKTSSASIITQLKAANTIFNARKLSIPPSAPVARQQAEYEEEEKSAVRAKESFAERFLSKSKREAGDSYLGKKQQRVEKITKEQALNIAPSSYEQRLRDADTTRLMKTAQPEVLTESTDSISSSAAAIANAPSAVAEISEEPRLDQAAPFPQSFQVEVAPFQSVSINEDQVYVFRRIAIDNQIYRQGFIILVQPLLSHLATTHFKQEPLAQFTTIRMARSDLATNRPIVKIGPTRQDARFHIDHVFPPPFHFLKASMSASDIPTSPARRSLNMALAVLIGFMLLGLIAIYHSVKAIVLMSEKRAQFVSSVTHELKTPLTNIRMYIEMLEQGIATTPEHEQEYLAILNSESARLSGLINNVLELAKLEKKQRQFHLQPGHINELFYEVKTIMAEKLRQSGFTLRIEQDDIPEFNFDREVLIQILTNLIDNSIKFGHESIVKEISLSARQLNNTVQIEVTDTGPGIPNRAINYVFQDFYRVDNALTRKTGGTGIGLSLVKKFMDAMGGKVKVFNNRERGCTFRLELPLNTNIIL